MSRPNTPRLPVLLRIACLLGLTTVLGSCVLERSYINHGISPEAVATLQPGVSTSADVVAALGAPGQVVELGNRSAYLYAHSLTKGAGLYLFLFNVTGRDTRTDRVWVFFDEGGLLTHVGSTLSAEEARYRLPIQSR